MSNSDLIDQNFKQFLRSIYDDPMWIWIATEYKTSPGDAEYAWHQYKERGEKSSYWNRIKDYFRFPKVRTLAYFFPKNYFVR